MSISFGKKTIIPPNYLDTQNIQRIPLGQQFTATANQTVFNLSNEYEIGKKQVFVEVDGVPQEVGVGFTESSTTSITLTEGVPAGSIVRVNLFQTPAGVNKKLVELDQLSQSNSSQLADIATIHVKNYGVVGDGVTDDTVNLTTAITDSMSKKKGLDFGNLTVKITSQITIPNGVLKWVGSGAVVKPVIPSAATTVYWFDNHNATDLEVYIEGIIFDGINVPLPSTAVGRIPLSFQGTIANPVKSIALKNCKIQNLLWEESPNVAVDHATRFYHAKNVKVTNCEFNSVKGWSIFLQDVDGFEISGNKSDGNYFGAIELRGGCRNGSVHHNTITNCTGAYSGGIDMLGIIDEGLNENVKIHDNTCEGQFVYGVGLRVLSAKKIDVHNNTVIIKDTDVVSGRYGITAGNKIEVGNSSIIEDITIENNTIITTADTVGGILVFNTNAAFTPFKDIHINNNKIIERGGKFIHAGIKINQISGTIAPFENLQVENNKIQASLGANYLAGISIYGHDTDITKALKNIMVKNNEIKNSGDGYVTGKTIVGIYVNGYMLKGEIKNNTIDGYYYPIETPNNTKIYSVEINNNPFANCVLGYSSVGLYHQPSLHGSNGKPSESTSLKNIPSYAIFMKRVPNTFDVKGWYVTKGGNFSSLTTTGTGTNGTNTITVANVQDFIVGEEIKITGTAGTKFIMKIVGTTFTLDSNLDVDVTSVAVSHVAPTVRAMQFPTYGTTAQRPTSTLSTVDVGFVYHDTTLLKPVFWNGTAWIDATGATV